MNAAVEVLPRIPILMVDEETIFPDHNETTDTNNRPNPISSTAVVVTPMPTGIQFVGVGFGPEPDGQPQGALGKNPFLNFETIN
jgi:hypothetical protein